MFRGINEVPWTFKKWLSKFESVDLPIGDLARDVSNDSNFPTSEDYRVLYRYLESNFGHPNALYTLKTTWRFYQQTK